MPTHYKGKKGDVRALDTYIKLMRAGNSVSARLARHLDTHHISLSQFAVLEVLLHLGPLRQCQIALKLLKSGANITTVLDNLEKRKLILRTPDPVDRRSTVVELTGDGRTVIGEVFPRQVEVVTTIMSALEADEQEELARLCKKLGLTISDR
jgi:MarR family transcriptional regulator, 2-MHQ and catechol-resistance regulon repressor